MEKPKQDLWNVLAQHGARANTSNASARRSGETRAPSSIICCDLSLEEDTLMRVVGATRRNEAPR